MDQGGPSVNLHLKNSRVLVTGSSRGIGLGIAKAFTKEGAQVVITGRTAASLEQVAEIPLQFCGDLVNSPDITNCVDYVEKNMDGLDHLICNIGSGRSLPILAEDSDEFLRMLEINLLGAQRIVQAMIPLLKKSAAQKGNVSILFISSICSLEALGCPTAYASAKAALNSYAKTISRPLGQLGIRANILSPGNILFPGSTWEDKWAQNADRVQAMLDKEVPLQRLGTLNEVADVALFLASSKASFVNGANWIVDGGQLRSI